MKTNLQTLLDSGQPIIADGAMGSMLFSMGLDRGASAELWNVEQPEKVGSVHRAYIEAGAQIILTNTLGGTRIRLQMDGLDDRTAEVNRAGGPDRQRRSRSRAHTRSPLPETSVRPGRCSNRSAHFPLKPPPPPTRNRFARWSKAA